MARVPTIDETAVGAQPYGSGGVAPVRNSAPEQLLNLGNTVQQAGLETMQRGETLGDRIAGQVDDARTKQAETQFLTQAQSILHDPQSGYFNTKGQDAVQQYDPAKQSLVQAGQTIRDSLTNGLQKRMFQQVLDHHLLTFGGQMADYNHSQSVAWSAQESKARSDQYSLLAAGAMDSRYQKDADGNVAGDFAKYTKQMESEVLNSAGLAGFDPNSAQAKSMLRGQYTALNTAMIARMLDNHDAYGAKQWYDEQVAAGNIDLRNQTSLGNAVKGEYDRQVTNDLADRAVSASLTPSPEGDKFMVSSSPKGLVEKGNIPIWNRPTVKNDDGSVSTEYSTSFGDESGREILVPTVVNGKFLTPDGKKPKEGSPEEKAMFKAAQQHYEETGENLGKFSNPDDANAYSEALHNRGTGTKGAPVTLSMPISGSSINVTAGLGEPRPGNRSHDGIDIAVPVGTQVMAPATGKVTKVWTDDKFGGGLSVEMQLPNGLTAGFAHLSATNVREGDELQQGGTIGLSGKSGNATGPVLHYMMKDADGKYVDPRQVSQPQPNKEGISDPDAAEKARQYILDSDAPPEIKRAAITQVQTAHTQYRELQNQKQTALYKQASDAFYSAGENVHGIQPSLFMQLTPEQQQEFKDKQVSKVQRDYSQGQFFKEMGEVDIRSQFIQNPDQLTEQNVEAARARLSNTTYLSLMKQAQEQKMNPRGVQEAQGIQDQVNYLASHAGINIRPTNKQPEAQQTWVDLNARIQQSLNQARANSGGKVTQEQAQKIIQQELIQHTTSVPRSAWNPLVVTGILSPTATRKLPMGAVSTGRGSDGKDHYLDRNGQDLGIVGQVEK